MAPKKFKRLRIIEDSSEDEHEEATVNKGLPPTVASTNKKLLKLRRRKKFPCPHCEKKGKLKQKAVINLPRHLRNVHGFSDNSATYATMNLGLREKVVKKRRKRNDPPIKDYHERTKCEEDGCSAVVLRLSLHLKSYHRMTPQEILEKYGVTPRKKQNKCKSSQSSLQSSSDNASALPPPTSVSPNRFYQDTSSTSQSPLPPSSGHQPSHIKLQEPTTSKAAHEFMSKYISPTQHVRENEQRGHLSTSHSSLASHNSQHASQAQTRNFTEENLSDYDDNIRDADYIPDVETDDSDEYEPSPKRIPFDKVIVEMESYLSSPLGQDLDSGTINQHTRQMQTLMSCVGGDDYHSLLDILVVNSCFQSLRLSKSTGGKGLLNKTLRGYISSLKHLIKFFKTHPKFDTKLVAADLELFNVQLTDLSTGMKTACRKETLQRRQKDLCRLPHSNHLKSYLNSSLREVLIKKVLGVQNKGCIISQNEKVILNGVMFIEVSLDNANRAGEVRHLKLKDYRDGVLEDDGTFSITIQNHKTSGTSDASILTINKDLLTLLKIYKKYIRPTLEKPDSPENFFLTTHGTRLNTSSMRYYMQAVWNKLNLSSQVGPTLMRKKAVTEIHQHYPHASENLATKMNHSIDTAKREYFLIDKKIVSKKISSMLRTMITGPPAVDKTPVNTAAVDMTPVDSTTVDMTPVDMTPVDMTAVDSTTVDMTPVDMAPVDSTTVEMTPVDITPVNNAAVDTEGTDIGEEDTDTADYGQVENDTADYGQVDTASVSNAAPRTMSVFEMFADPEEDLLNKNPRNKFSHAEECAMVEQCGHLFNKNTRMSYDEIMHSLKKTLIGRHIVRKFKFDQIKNKLNYFKYRKCNKKKK